MGINLVYERIREKNLYLPENVQSIVFNRQASTIIYVFNRSEPLYFVKVSRDYSQNYQVESEYENLLILKRRISHKAGLVNTVPTPILFGYCGDRAFSVTDLFVGKKDLKGKKTRARSKDAFAWLITFHRETMGEALFEKDFLTQYVRKFSGCTHNGEFFSKQFEQRIAELVQESSFFDASLIPVCFSHNDFSSANILFNGKKIFVIDWVSSTERGFPLIDLLDICFYRINKGRNNYLESFKLFLESRDEDISFFRNNIKQYVEEFNVSDNMFRFLLRIFFLSKAEKFFLNKRHDRYIQLMKCFRHVEKAGRFHENFQF